ncbi:MAG: peptidoglycan bridge formation glycyltransferase FemA/FemB family protein [Treponema sp.]|nr:peptidoglycan bridge formation glycyltransferase FemA/FemB family protein [Treponema sp.]
MNYISDIVLAELSVCENADNFLQSSMWAEFKSRFGWNAKAFLVNSSPLLILCRKLAPGFSFAYIPWGPKLPESFSMDDRAKTIAELSKKLKPFLARNTVFIRFEPPWFFYNDDINFNEEQKLLLNAGFKRAAATVQAPDTVIIDLKPSCEEILGAMKSKWRYNISLAEKKGVQVKVSGAEDIETFYNLLKETAQ